MIETPEGSDETSVLLTGIGFLVLCFSSFSILTLRRLLTVEPVKFGSLYILVSSTTKKDEELTLKKKPCVLPCSITH